MNDKRSTRGDETKLKILNEGVKLWGAQQGKFTLREISNALNVDYTLVLYHFNKAEKLRAAIIDHAIDGYLTEPNEENRIMVAMLIVGNHESVAHFTDEQRKNCLFHSLT